MDEFSRPSLASLALENDQLVSTIESLRQEITQVKGLLESRRAEIAHYREALSKEGATQ